MTRLSIVHRTGYKYKRRVTLSYNEARMTPLTDPQQVVLESSMKVTPSQAAVSSYRDYWGTRVTAFDMQMPHEHLEVLATTTVEVHRAVRVPSEADIVGWDDLASPETLNQFSDWAPQSQLTGPGEEVLAIIPGVVEGKNPHEAALAIFAWMRGDVLPGPGRRPGSWLFRRRGYSGTWLFRRGFHRAAELGPPGERRGDLEPPARDRIRRNADEVVLLACLPREEVEARGIEDLLGALERCGLPLDHHAPGHPGFGIYAVGFQCHRGFPEGATKLGALRRAEHQRAVVHRVVERENVRVVLNPDGQPANRNLAEQMPALAGIQVLNGLVGCFGRLHVGHGPEPTPEPADLPESGKRAKNRSAYQGLAL
jgi:hypothetical protein